MPKDFNDAPKEPARSKAGRRWRNYDIEKRFKEEVKTAKVESKEAKEPEIAEIIKNEKVDGRRRVIRAQTKFAEEIRTMMVGHAQRNVALYRLTLLAQLRRLKLEKLRRLEASAVQRGSGERQ
jgi:hypothetical protein